MAKSAFRKSRLTGSERAKIEKLIRRGWKPGFRIGDFLSRNWKGVVREQ